MSRYIDADELLTHVKDLRINTAEGYEFRHRCIDPQYVYDAPTADVVPVVRCKDCKYKRGGGFKRSEKDGWSVEYILPCGLGDDGFCSKGEKADE